MKSYTSRCLRVIAMAIIVGEYKANVKENQLLLKLFKTSETSFGIVALMSEDR